MRTHAKCCQACQNILGGPEDCYRAGTVANGEHGRKFSVKAKDSNEHFCVVTVDGCLIKGSETQKCDALVFRCKTQDYYLVEFKGANIQKAYDQIVDTISQLNLHDKSKVYGFIVCSKVPPGTKAQQLKEQFRRHGYKLEIHSRQYVYSV